MTKRKRIWHVGPKGDRYRTAIRLWGRWRIHIFWRGDKDRAPHDHPNDFWTFPLIGYWESTWDISHRGECVNPRLNYVRPFRWHFRPATYTHRVIGAFLVTPWRARSKAFMTLVREGPEYRKWGFWTFTSASPKGRWVYWREHLGKSSGQEG